MSRVRTLREIARHFGWGWIAYRGYHALLHKTGWLERRLPAVGWGAFTPQDTFSDPKLGDAEQLAQYRAEASTAFLFSADDRESYRDILLHFDGEQKSSWASQQIDAIERGELSYFSNPPIAVGFPPAWNDNLLEGKPGPKPVHFAHLDEFGYGDVKCIWEPNRFAFAYDLVRAYWRSGDERAPELFWQTAEDWVQHNPPNTGINWKCEQESTFRAMAWCFALWGFADSPATTPARVALAVKLMAVTARRIEAHIKYGLSQKNNHGISEAMGLFTIGLLFPELRGSKRWVEKGTRYLESQAKELIYDDGAFSQQSANYHRVMLHDYLYAIRIGELNGRPLSDELRGRVASAGRFLHEIQDAQTGYVPRYGQEDGALVLPLTNQPYEDARPVVQATAAVAGRGSLPWANGPWDEEALWLAGPEALGRAPDELETRGDTYSALVGGCHVLRSTQGMAFLRAQTYRHRPSQLDALHADIWWRGVNVALDPGTYSYNGQGHWAPIPLALTGAHNTVMVEGNEHAGRAGRFLFMPWPKASRVGPEPATQSPLKVWTFRCETTGGEALTRTAIQLPQEHWLFIDRVAQAGDATARLHWNLPDAPHTFDEHAGRVTLDLSPGQYAVEAGAMGGGHEATLVRADEGSPRGWYAPRYQTLSPCLSLAVTAPTTDARPAVFYSCLGPSGWRCTAVDDTLGVVAVGWSAEMKLSPDAVPGRVTISGSVSAVSAVWDRESV